MGVSLLESACTVGERQRLRGGASREGHTGWEQSQVAEVK